MDPVHSGIMYPLYEALMSQRARWQKCDLLLSCPATIESVRLCFADIPVVCANDANDALNTLIGKRCAAIGVVSPWLMQSLMEHPTGPYMLLRACRSELLFAAPRQHYTDESQLRETLHRVGFYQVAVLAPDATPDAISVSLTAEGRYALYGSTPAFHGKESGIYTYVATRMASLPIREAAWRNVCPSHAVPSTRGYVAPRDGFVLALTSDRTDSTSPEAIRIQAEFRWIETDRRGHASLVGSYSGPSDTNMYAWLLLFSEQQSPYASLWVQRDSWRLVAQYALPEKALRTHEGECSTQLWLRIDPTHIAAGYDAISLCEITNQEVARTAVVGIRLQDDAIGISRIAVKV